MQNYVGIVAEFQLTAEGKKAARITCPEKAIPAPGQYVLAHAPADTEAPLATVLFNTEGGPGSFVAAPPIPDTWQLGTSLHIYGPLGKGFRIPGRIRNLALVALGDTISRLLPLLPLADNTALFLSPSLSSLSPFLPTSIEINPLSDLPSALTWAEVIAIDLPLEQLAELRRLLALPKGAFPPCPVQVLVHTPMPCGGRAACGVCAVGRGSHYMYACLDGPVLDLNNLLRET